MQLLEALQIDHLYTRGYSVRRGGATFLFRTDGRFDVTMERGRWTSLTTTRKYLEDAAAAVASLKVPDWSSVQLGILADEFVALVTSIAGKAAVARSPLLSEQARSQLVPEEVPQAPRKRQRVLPRLHALDAPPPDDKLQQSLRRLCRS